MSGVVASYRTPAAAIAVNLTASTLMIAFIPMANREHLLALIAVGLVVVVYSLTVVLVNPMALNYSFTFTVMAVATGAAALSGDYAPAHVIRLLLMVFLFMNTPLERKSTRSTWAAWALVVAVGAYELLVDRSSTVILWTGAALLVVDGVTAVYAHRKRTVETIVATLSNDDDYVPRQPAVDHRYALGLLLLLVSFNQANAYPLDVAVGLLSSRFSKINRR